MSSSTNTTRRFRYSLRTLLLFSLFLVLVFAVIGWNMRRKADRVAHGDLIESFSPRELVEQLDPQAVVTHGGGGQTHGTGSAVLRRDEDFGIQGSSLSTIELVDGVAALLEKKLSDAGALQIDSIRRRIGLSPVTRLVYEYRGSHCVITIRATEVNSEYFDVYFTSNVLIIR
jgi:hypothetical protein